MKFVKVRNMDDDTYWLRFGDRKMSYWPHGSKERVLRERFPGAKTAWDAVRSLISKHPDKSSKDQRAAQAMEMTLAEKFAQVSGVIEQKLSLVDESLIPKEARERLAAMPLDTVDQVRLWGFAWIEEIKKLETT